MKRLVYLIIIMCAVCPNKAYSDTGLLIMEKEGWPTYFELNIGDTYTVTRKLDVQSITRTVKLLSIKEFQYPNCHYEKTFEKTEVVVDVSGVQAALLLRPYQMPVVINGLRLYVEMTKNWATQCEIAQMRDVKRDVRFSAVAEGETWGPAEFVFPIRNFRWHSSTYNNTWSQLVPYNKLYYHRGDDFGAIPDQLDVVSSLDGEILMSPQPKRSNALMIRNTAGIIQRFSHMNTNTINQKLTKGTKVHAGQFLGKTGDTWRNKKQYNDPHLHVSLSYDKNTSLATYPFLIEAYFNAYSDPVLAVAGGYAYTTVGNAVELDGSRSIARPGHNIYSYTWLLHDGSVVKSPTTYISYDRPGIYSEELRVKTIDGSEDRDYLQVRVYDSQMNCNIAKGWIYHTPVRRIKPKTNILFWNRLYNTISDTKIDFGDSSPIQSFGKEIMHAYTTQGLFTVTVNARGPQNEAVTVKMRVVVENSDDDK